MPFVIGCSTPVISTRNDPCGSCPRRRFGFHARPAISLNSGQSPKAAHALCTITSPLPPSMNFFKFSRALLARIGRLPVQVVEHDRIVGVELGRSEELRVGVDLGRQPPIGRQELGDQRRGLLPLVPGILVAGQHQDLGLTGGAAAGDAGSAAPSRSRQQTSDQHATESAGSCLHLP